MSKRTIMIEGVEYHSTRPRDCSKCFFWKNKKVGCILKKQNCYYLVHPVKTEQEKKCEGCPYSKDNHCVSASCYLDLDRQLTEKRRAKKKEAEKGVSADEG